MPTQSCFVFGTLTPKLDLMASDSPSTANHPQPLPPAVGLLAQLVVFVASILVGVVCFFVAYVGYMMFSDAGDFSGIVGFLPALVAFIVGLCITASMGMRIARRSSA